MRRPRTVKIGSTRWKILYPRTIEGAVGLTFGSKHEIHVLSGLPEQEMRATLLHELLHAIAWAYGFHPDKSELEESVVSLFSTPLLTILQENATLARYLCDSASIG